MVLGHYTTSTGIAVDFSEETSAYFYRFNHSKNLLKTAVATSNLALNKISFSFFFSSLGLYKSFSALFHALRSSFIFF
jgi:hypothetical protein